MSASPDPRRSARLRRRGPRTARMPASPAVRPRRRAARFSLYGDSYVVESDASVSVDTRDRQPLQLQTGRDSGVEESGEAGAWLTPAKGLLADGDRRDSLLESVRESLFDLLGKEGTVAGGGGQEDDDDEFDGAEEDVVVESEDEAEPEQQAEFVLADAYDDLEFEVSLRTVGSAGAQLAREAMVGVARVVRSPPQAVKEWLPVLLVVLFAVVGGCVMKGMAAEVDPGVGRARVARAVADITSVRDRMPVLPALPEMTSLPSMPVLPTLPSLRTMPSLGDMTPALDAVNPMPIVFKALSATLSNASAAGAATIEGLRSAILAVCVAVQSLLTPRPPAPVESTYSADVGEVIETYAADKGAPPDFALASVGGKVLASSPSIGRLYIRYLANFVLSLAPTTTVGYAPTLPNFPSVALHPDVTPGNCWAFPGEKGSITVRLARPIRANGVTIEHTPKSSVFSVNSAPRDVNVYVQPLAHKGAAQSLEFVRVGKFVYDVSFGARHLQTFTLEAKSEELVARAVRFEILSNHGSATHTCLYRVRVHGEAASAVDAEIATQQQSL